MTRTTNICLVTAKRFKEMRLIHKLTRDQFSAMLDVPRTTLKNYELGYREPRMTYFKAIGMVMGMEWLGYVLGIDLEVPDVVDNLVGTARVNRYKEI